MRSFYGAVLCVIVVLLLSGCKSERLVYNANLEDTWYAVQSAAMNASDTSSYDANEKTHSLITENAPCSSQSDLSEVPNVSSNPDSIKYGSADPHRDYRSQRTYWYAVVQCRPADSGTEVTVSVHCTGGNSSARNDSRDYYSSDSCPEGDQWIGEFFDHLNKHLGEPVKVKK